MRIYSSSTSPVVDFPSFAKWHSEKWGNCYATPKSIEEVIRQERHYAYDPEKDCFFGFMGQFAPNPGERYDVSWREIAERFSSMYNSFASYGTN